MEQSLDACVRLVVPAVLGQRVVQQAQHLPRVQAVQARHRLAAVQRDVVEDKPELLEPAIRRVLVFGVRADDGRVVGVVATGQQILLEQLGRVLDALLALDAGARERERPAAHRRTAAVFGHLFEQQNRRAEHRPLHRGAVAGDSAADHDDVVNGLSNLIHVFPLIEQGAACSAVPINTGETNSTSRRQPQ